MSYADTLFKNMCRDILENGTSTEGEKVRPHWEDGTSAYTIKRFGVVNRYDLRKEFPALTLRKTALKSCMDEILWSQYREGMMDQMDRVLYDLKNNPFSRRIITNTYVHEDLSEMHLYPCAYSTTWNVTEEKGSDKLVLNMVLNQRSQDVLAANNWNVCQYAILLMMVAQVCDMVPGELLHVIADAHIYDRHVDAIRELIGREEYPAPKVHLNPEIKDFYQFTTADLLVEDYQAGPQIKNIPIAV